MDSEAPNNTEDRGSGAVEGGTARAFFRSVVSRMRGGGARATTKAAAKTATKAAAKTATKAAAKTATKAAAKASTKVTKTSVKTVAKITDISSNALDGVDAKNESNLTREKLTVDYERGGLFKVLGRVSIFGFNFLRNGIAGTAVFEVYDRSCDGKEVRPIKDHFLFGALSGSVFKFCNSGFDIVEKQLMRKHSVSPNAFRPSFLFSSLSYHVVTHSLLFGSYECSRRQLMYQSEYHYDDFNKEDFIAIGLAGCIGGFSQAVGSHVLEPLESNAGKGGLKAIQVQVKSVLTQPRVLFFSMFATSLGFLAFEYGKYV